jgi:hypothetical protein
MLVAGALFLAGARFRGAAAVSVADALLGAVFFAAVFLAPVFLAVGGIVAV